MPAAMPEPAAPRRPVAWLVAGVLLSALMVVGASWYARLEVRRLRDEQVALTERHRLDTLQLIRIASNVGTIEDTLRDMTDRSEPYPLAAWEQTFARLKVDLDQALTRERDLAPVARPAAQARQLDAAASRLWQAIDTGFVAARAGDDEAAIRVFTTDASARQAELSHQVSQLLIANTRADDEGTARARAVYDAADRQMLWLSVGLVAALLLAGATIIQAVRRSILALQQVSAERRALSWRMIRLQEDVQAGLARELHDEFGQVLTALGFGLARTRRRVEQGAAPAATLAAELGELQDLAKQVLDGIRQRSRALHPVVLDDFGLEHALRSHVELVARQTGLPIAVETAGDLAGLPGETATHLYRILQEALTNVVRHAGASDVAVSAVRDEGGITLTIDDDGRGVEVGGPASPGLGLTSMRERAALMGGTFTMGEGPLGGTRVTVHVPAAAG
ncbi:sensor histidine kinase [Luteitalea sp.]|jgi:signal transduction histidine kinase|uniref:sensor histidine kinase n=1 Tax=Luteitalea sp. TaxID=2004800 RepID=UPI0037C5CC96